MVMRVEYGGSEVCVTVWTSWCGEDEGVEGEDDVSAVEV